MTQQQELTPAAASFATHVHAFHGSLPWEEQTLLEQIFTLAEQAVGWGRAMLPGVVRPPAVRPPAPCPVTQPLLAGSAAPALVTLEL